MEYDKYEKITKLEVGDIIELEGKKYFMEFGEGRPCGHCALFGQLCDKYFGLNGKYSCASYCVYAISAEKKIKIEREKIEESENLIKRLS